MRQILYFEMKRCFTGRKMYVSLAMALLVSMGHIVFSVIPLTQWLSEWRSDYFQTPYSAYGHWIGADTDTIWPALLYLLFPLLAALPFADSVSWDFASGYCIQVFSRVPRRCYYYAKFVVVFLSGFGLTFAVLCFDFFITAMCLPLVRPEPLTRLYNITAKSFLAQLFYQHPFCYTVLSILLEALLIGAWVCIAFAVACCSKNKVQAALMPFIMFVAVYLLASCLGFDRFALFIVLLAFQTGDNIPLWTILCYLWVLPLVSFGIYCLKKDKNDVL